MIIDLETSEVIAEHLMCLDKGQVIKNRDHYRDKAQRIESLEADILQLLGSGDNSRALCALLKATSPGIYKDQLVGAKQILKSHLKQYGDIDSQLFARLIDTPRLTATGLRDRLAAYQQHPNREDSKAVLTTTEPQTAQHSNESLAGYSALNGQPGGQGESHANH